MATAMMSVAQAVGSPPPQALDNLQVQRTMINGLLTQLTSSIKGELDKDKKRAGREAIKDFKVAIKAESKRDEAFTWLGGACPNPGIPAGPKNIPALDKFLATWGEEECPNSGPQAVGVVLPHHMHAKDCACDWCDPISA
jgi:hypothetical protein